jgi:glycine dehydrogenase
MNTTLTHHDPFARRHNGPGTDEQQEMLNAIGVESLSQLIDETIPEAIRSEGALDIPPALTEYEYLRHLKGVASKNKVFRSYIGQGYFGTVTPSVILRNVFQNPGWYTQYTPYQAEIAQGRLESLLNYQTMVSDLTGLPIANASLLDEATAAAEAMAMFFGQKNKRVKGDPVDEFFVDSRVYAQTLDVLYTRAEPLGIRIVVGDWASYEVNEKTFGVLLQYPGCDGSVQDLRPFVAKMKEADVYVTVASDLLALALLEAPGTWDVDAVVGNAQRFGVPMGYGGPHAAFFATKEAFKRQIPGRIIGLSVDAHGNPALRMALQTREQHIRREKATSNICTAQALLANMAGFYAVYHGPEGIRRIAERVHQQAAFLGGRLREMGYTLSHDHYFDTVAIAAEGTRVEAIRKAAEDREINFHYTPAGVQVSLDETVTSQDLHDILSVFAEAAGLSDEALRSVPERHDAGHALPNGLTREVDYLTHEVFHAYHTESTMMRYIKRLENKDLSLVHSMIALGSCTMKLNAATELIPVSWPEFANIHPFAPAEQAEGYHQIFRELEHYLSEVTGFTACSLQPNSGAQGEYTGLMVIRAYHIANGDNHRDVALIPSSAHGTNPASAVMAGMNVVVVGTDDHGNIDLEDLKKKVSENADRLAALMVTYPSTHGVFEAAIRDICDLIHEHGGLVYMDGANMNAQVGLTSPGAIHADVCHLNLHKTFAIPHGGGGPGMGPICVNEKLAPFLPSHVLVPTGGEKGIQAVSAAPFGSASILLISYAYIRMLGPDGLRQATEIAILNANYIKARLESEYQVLYVGEKGRSAHELIIDLRPFKALDVSAEDVAKRLMDYGFHAPTLSFPVAGTIMIEPTESEDKAELDRFCEAMLQIKREIEDIASGVSDSADNVLHNAPHTVVAVTADSWSHPYSREQAAWPLPWVLEQGKFWPTVGRVDNAYGDRHLVCTCPPMEAYEQE